MKILFVYKHKRSFVETDLEILQKHYDVKPFFFKSSKILSLRRELKNCDVVFIWFASFHAYVTARLTRKPIVVVTGGYDVAGEKSINYGLMLHPIYKRMVRYVLKKATKILAVSEFNKKEIEKHLGMTDVEVIYNSIDYNKFKPKGKKEDIILTVGFVKKETWIRKGISEFIEVAQLFSLKDEPGRFVIVGKINDFMAENVAKIKSETPNLKFTGFVSDEELLKWYQKAKVYCQLSRYESFGIAPGEAMLCECVPVVADNGALPEVVGDAGFYANHVDTEYTKHFVMEALKSKKGKKARERIKKLFPPEYRERELKRVIDSI